jgi:hypothetical protein
MFRYKDLYISLASPDDEIGLGVGPEKHDVKKSTPNCAVIRQVGNLKEYLVKALAITVEIEKELEEHPRTVAEVELLEEKLKEALDDLRARKMELEKKAA